MAGINRLGRAPPKPGSLRPPDPNKNRTMDMYSDNAEQDLDYMRMVQDIEDAQQSQVGWLFGRGAFDKGDLLYLRDEEEKRRHAEMNLRDGEKAQYERLRRMADVEAPDVAPGVAPLGRKISGTSSSAKPLRPRPKIVKVRPKGAHEPPNPDEDAAVPAAKKPRTETGAAAPAGVGPAADISSGLGEKEEDPHHQQSAAASNEGTAAVELELPGLLGDYGSESDQD